MSPFVKEKRPFGRAEGALLLEGGTSSRRAIKEMNRARILSFFSWLFLAFFLAFEEKKRPGNPGPGSGGEQSGESALRTRLPG
jgi:hypothetical protein